MSSKIAIIWGRGWIGGEFVKVLCRRGWGVVNANSRADDKAAVLAEIDDLERSGIRATHVVCAIGRTHGPGFATIDYLEQPGKLVENIRDNLRGPTVLAEVAKAKGLHMLYFGTGCIFEYDEAHALGGVPFTEEDRPNFFGSEYSIVKGFSDTVMRDDFPGVLNARIRMPISAESGPRDFITKLVNYKNICSIPNSVTVLGDILPILAFCMETKTTGTLNAVNPGAISHGEVLELYRASCDPAHTWNEVDEKQLMSLVVARRSNNYLSTDKIEALAAASGLCLPNAFASIVATCLTRRAYTEATPAAISS